MFIFLYLGKALLPSPYFSFLHIIILYPPSSRFSTTKLLYFTFYYFSKYFRIVTILLDISGNYIGFYGNFQKYLSSVFHCFQWFYPIYIILFLYFILLYYIIFIIYRMFYLYWRLFYIKSHFFLENQYFGVIFFIRFPFHLFFLKKALF